MTRLNIKIYRNLMGANDRWAQRTRTLLKKHHVIMLNLINSPSLIYSRAKFAAVARRKGRRCISIPQALCNEADAAKSVRLSVVSG